jgi:hypothetical protein
MLDNSGELVWFRPLSDHGSPDLRAFNVRTQSYKGQRVLCWFQGRVVQDHGLGHYVVVDSSYRTVAKVRADHGYAGDLHEFFITSHGTAMFTCYGTRATDLTRFGGSSSGSYYYGVVQEVDIATGKLLFEWRSDDEIPLEESYVIPALDHSWDYFHINSISIDPSDGNLIVSGRNTWACYKLNRTTGAVMWRLGGKNSDFLIQRDARFAFQHDVIAHGSGIFTVFDNEAGPPRESSSSRGLILHVNEKSRLVRLVRSLSHKPPILSNALGSVQLLADGHAFVGWGTTSYFTEYDSGGAVLFDGYFEGPTHSYRAFKEQWEGQPLTHPAVHAALEDDRTIVWVSWNGATRIVSWRLLVGRRANSLTAAREQPRAGFETQLDVGGQHRWIRVEALDSSGNVLGRSKAYRVAGA